MKTQKCIVVDAREWNARRMTGIGRMLAGFVEALAERPLIEKIVLAMPDADDMPARLKGHHNVASIPLPRSFLAAEWALSGISGAGYAAFISPYWKLPLFGVRCPSVHTIHDVQDLTSPLYRDRLRTVFDRYRLKSAISRADLTWYDSQWSMKETGKLVRITGGKARVRFLGVDDCFNDISQMADLKIVEKFGLISKAYILVVGNGLPHKNLGLLLGIAKSNRMDKQLVFAGVSQRNRNYWEQRYPQNRALWIGHVPDEEVPSLLRNAFCLAQPSLTEGYGYPPLEAMACGTPAVVSAIEVLIETTGGNALVAETSDGQSWLEAFERIENKEVYQAQVRKGLQWITKMRGRKGWQGHIADLEELIRSHQ